MNHIDLPPYAPTLMESTRAIGYSIEAAIADVIDNSIAAKASRVDIDFFPIGESYISILDNGTGMTEQDLISAMQYGSRNPLEERDADDLGRYGLGMKTASLSQCRILTVLTKRNGVFSGAQWNLNYIQETESWSLLLIPVAEADNYPSYHKLKEYKNGTLIIWQDLDKFAVGESDMAEAFSRKMGLIREHLSLVFHRYLSGEPGLVKLDIKMNGESVEPQDPFLSKKSTQLMDAETIIVRGQKVRVTPYILPHTSKLTQKELKALGGKDGLRKNQGFYVYRNKRLLVWGSWFRLMRQGDLSKLARVQVDIPNSLDDLYYLSEYDMDAVRQLGFNTRMEAMNTLSSLIGSGNNYLKLRRDEFDALPDSSSTRKGWRNRPAAKEVLEIATYLHQFSFSELSDIVQSLINNYTTQGVINEPENKNNQPVELTEEEIEQVINSEDPAARLVLGTHANYHRVYDRSIIVNLKKLYRGRCQICGKNPVADFNVNICEAHHLEYFSKSQNNNASNIIIVCPNHHRLIHSLKPEFNYDELVFTKNGTTLFPVNVDLHLKK